MSSVLSLPILKELIQDGIDYGSVLLVEFEADSLWYETSLTLAAQALRADIRTAYHTFQHNPKDVRLALGRLGLDVKKLENDTVLEVIDSYTVQIGLGPTEKDVRYSKDSRYTVSTSLKIADWSLALLRAMKGRVPEESMRWLHIDDNTGVLLQYNEEKAIIDYWRTRSIPDDKAAETVVLHSFLTGVGSAPFFKQFESLCDGIFDFTSDEKEEEIKHYTRVRIMRGKHYNSRWRRLKVLDNGEVTLVD